MKTHDLVELREAFDFPIYVVTPNATGAYVDVLGEKDGAVTRQRYFTTAGTQCTCMGFLKGGNCRHLKMLAGDYSWASDGKGAVGAYAIEEATRLAESVGQKHYPDFAGGWVPDPESVPDIVLGIELRVGSGGPGGVERFVAVKNFADGQKLAVALIFGSGGSPEGAENPEETGE